MKKTSILIIIAILLLLLIFVVVNKPVEAPDGNISLKENAPAENTQTESAEKTAQEMRFEELKDAPLTNARREEKLRPEGDEKFKIFDLEVRMDGFSPTPIVVEKGDLIQLNILSGSNTDIESRDLNFYMTLTPETKKVLSFEASKTGAFSYYCRNMCPSEERIFGEIVVVERRG